MKNGQIELNCRNDNDTFLEDEILLNITSNGLYAIPITAAKQLLEKTNSQSPHHHIVLRTTDEKSNRELAKKLRRPFANPTIDKPLALINKSDK